MKELGYAEDYKYAHNYAGNFVDQEFLPKEISGKVFYNPANNPKEAELRRSLATKWKKYNY
jgi:putative ATPase